MSELTALTCATIRERCQAHAAMPDLLEARAAALSEAAALLVGAIRAGGRVFTCGNGGSASEAQHFASELVGRFRHDRRALPATALSADTSAITAIANDYGFEHTFARQIEGLGGEGDVLVAFSTSGVSRNVVQAAATARACGLRVISVTGQLPNPLARMADVSLAIPSTDTPTIQEFHMVLTHVLCGVVESDLMRDESGDA